MKTYRAVSLVLMILFAITGILFLVSPDRPVAFFNDLSSSMFPGMPQAPSIGWNFYLILAAGYMYLVTVLAFLMFKHRENRHFPLLLAHGKLASSILSLAFFLMQARYLIYMANFAVDGAIGIVVLLMYARMRNA